MQKRITNMNGFVIDCFTSCRDEDDDDWNLEDYGNGRLNGHLPNTGRRDEAAGKPRVSLSASRLASGQSMSGVRNKFSNTPQMSRSFAGGGDEHQRLVEMEGHGLYWMCIAHWGRFANSPIDTSTFLRVFSFQ